MDGGKKFFFSSRRRHTRLRRDWSSDVCSSDLSMKVVEKTFTPEFRNRLDAIIQFKPLDIAIVGNVVDKFIFELESLLADKNVTLALDADARLWLAEHGCDAKMGARPMARLIQEKIKTPLADDLLFGRLVNGGHVRIFVENKDLAFEVASKQLTLTEKSESLDRTSDG